MSAITDALRITRSSLQLDDVDPRSTPGFEGAKADGQAALEAGADALSALQERLYAASRAGSERSVLLVVQGMDTSGKGGIMRHVVGQVDPQGVQLTAFKAPTAAELRHDFLWRIERALPTPGMIGVFDRSHYEDVLIHRVRGLSKPEVVQERYGRIVEFEKQAVAQGIEVVKVMLHISREEQGERLLERLDRPDKHWKFNPGDIDEREHWDAYMEAYQVAVNRTARAAAPWFVVPADRKWYARLAVQQILTEALERVDPQWPEADFDVAAERERLLATMGGAQAAADEPEEALPVDADAVADDEDAPKRKKGKGKKDKPEKDESKKDKSKDKKSKKSKSK